MDDQINFEFKPKICDEGLSIHQAAQNPPHYVTVIVTNGVHVVAMTV